MRAIAVAIAALALASPAAAGPPPGLTVHGRLVWQLDALVRDTYGRQAVCTLWPANENKRILPAAGCRNHPLSDWSPYEYVFAGARRSSLTLGRHPTLAEAGNVGPIRVGSRYVMCGPASWLVYLSTGPLVCS